MACNSHFIRRISPAVFFGLLVMIGWMVATPSNAKVRTAHAAENASNTPDPEILLLEVYKALAANNLRNAQAKADALVKAYPTFLLGQLIRGDLLLMHTRPITTFGAMKNAPKEKLDNLRDEAMARLKSLRERPDPDLMPRALMQLREDQKYALIVDAKKSRLYVYENRKGKLKFMSDYYISQGKSGVNKLKAGDQKTPLGVYYITQRVPGKKLPDFYGVGALPINYPNDWDKRNGRSGSGIWLHGTPSDSYSRPPLSSDGCVVLTNPDFHKLNASVEVNKTPVVIADEVEFVSKAQWDADRGAANKLLDKWRRDVESKSAARLMSNYSSQFKSDKGEQFSTWFAKHRQLLTSVKNVSIKFRDVTFFRYPGHEEMIVGTFTQDSLVGKRKSSVRKRQYWTKDGAQWKIISEANL